MTNLTIIKDELKKRVKFQQTPVIMLDSEYLDFVIMGAKRLYVDKGIEDNFNNDYDSVLQQLNINVSISDEEYVIISSQIAFLNQIKADVAQILGYTTNALSITGANKPYENISKDIADLESRLGVLAFKFTHNKV